MKTKAFFAICVIMAAAMAIGGCRSSKNTSPEQARQDSIANVVAATLLERQQYALVASRISLGNSPTINVISNSNFIRVDGDECIMQLHPRNSVGAFNAHGRISGYSCVRNKNGDTNVRFHFSGKLGSAEVMITLYRGSKRAQGYIDATFSRGRATYYGEIEAINTQLIKID